jgi:hypothetical protein
MACLKARRSSKELVLFTPLWGLYSILNQLYSTHTFRYCTHHNTVAVLDSIPPSECSVC